MPLVVGVVRAHDASDPSCIPEPRVATRFWQDEPLERNYAWSQTAWEIADDYDRARSRPRSVPGLQPSGALRGGGRIFVAATPTAAVPAALSDCGGSVLAIAASGPARESPPSSSAAQELHGARQILVARVRVDHGRHHAAVAGEALGQTEVFGPGVHG